jgi:hypothetical protein
MQKRPAWRWTSDREVMIDISDEGPKTFQLIPMDREAINQLTEDLAVTQEITEAFRKAIHHFESGTWPDYKGALQRVKDLRSECQLALDEQLMVARGIALMFEPADIDREFGMFVNVLTNFAFEAAERALKPPTPKTPADPPAPPDATEPPACEPPNKESEEAPAAPVVG